MRKCPLVLDGVINRWWWVESMLSSILNTRLWAGGVAFHPPQLETSRLDESPEGTDCTQTLRSLWTPKPFYMNQKEWPPRLLKVDTAEIHLLSLCWHQLHDTTCKAVCKLWPNIIWATRQVQIIHLKNIRLFTTCNSTTFQSDSWDPTSPETQGVR